VRESYEGVPALAAERVEILGGNGNGAVDSNESNDLAVYVRNQGTSTGSQLSAQLSSGTPGVIVLQQSSAYPDVPHGEVRANLAMFQIQTTAGFIEGTPVDIVLVLNSSDASTTNYLRLFTGNPNPAILFDGYSALAEAVVTSSRLKDLAPLDLGSFEPLWMSDDGSCLLKGGSSYVLWHSDGTIEQVSDPGFTAHRLTHQGVVVGQLSKPNTVDEFGNQLGHTIGVRWEPGAGLVPLTLTGYGYRFPKDAIVETKKGTVYDAATGNLLDFVTDQPTLHSVWDLNARNQAVGAASVYTRPLDLDADGEIGDFEITLGIGHLIRYDAAGAMNWETTTERGYSTAPEAAAKYAIAYNALLTTAALFDNIDSQWRWLGPLSFEPGNPAAAIALLINDTGVVAGYGGIVTGNSEVDAMIPTHAFRWTGTRGEFGGNSSALELDATPVLEDLGVLPGGIYSQPYAMNAAGDLVGYSDFDQVAGGVVRYNPYNFHGVYWAATTNSPQSLGSLGAVGLGSRGYSYAFAVNDREQIVGTSLRPQDGASAAVLWQRNHNTNGEPFWETNDLNLRVIGDNWFVLSAVGINNNGVILASGIRQNGQSGSQNRSLLLVPVSLAVDVSRNREITLDQADATTPQRVFRFWINDDNDDGDIVTGTDNLPGRRFFRNYEDNHVNGRADVIDFFPVFFELHELLQEFPPEHGYQFHLSQADNALNFVYTDLTRASAFDYLTNPDQPIYGSSFNKAAHEADSIRVTSGGVRLNDDFLQRVREDENKGVILIEGRRKTTEPLMLEIRRNGQVFPGVPLYLSIDGVESMYRWVNLRRSFNVLGEKQPNIAYPSRTGTAPNAPDSESNGRQMIYVHGFNVPERESRAENAEMYKRLWQSGSRAVFTGVSWYGSQKNIWFVGSLDYHVNVRNAFLTAPYLKEAVDALPGAPKFITGHSLGNMVISSAIVDHQLNVESYFGIDAAVAMEAYDGSLRESDMVNPVSYSTFSGWRNYDPRLWASEWYQLFDNTDGRSKLTWRDRFGAIPNFYNFYSSGEEVLKNSPADTIANGSYPRLGKEYIWTSQEMRKGTTLYEVLSFVNVVNANAEAGWGLNNDLFVNVSPGTADGGTLLRVRTPAEATPADLSDEMLKTNPFFKPFNNARLVDPIRGSSVASDPAVRADALAAAIPAVSHALGANSSPAFAQNLNLSTPDFQTGWPAERLRKDRLKSRWLHSDLKDVGYPFNHGLHQLLVQIGGLAE
jgi:hypothetical protein